MTFEYSKHKKRQMTSFFGLGHLFDFYEKKLDKERANLVEDFVRFSRDAQLEVDLFKKGDDYLNQIRQATPSDQFLKEAKKPNSYFYNLLQKSQYPFWPSGVRWGLESVVVVAIIVATISILPWNQILYFSQGGVGREILLVELKKADMQPLTGPENSAPDFQDEGIEKDAVESVTPVDSGVAALPAKDDEVSTSPVVVAKTEKVEVVTAKPITPVVQKKPLPAGVPEVTAGGYLYRGSLSVSGLNSTSPKIRERIEELGGRKAGEVALGWSRSPSSHYYHFTIPDAKYSELMSYFDQFGKLKIQREKHPRVMPDGILRLIVTVEEASQ